MTEYHVLREREIDGGEKGETVTVFEIVMTTEAHGDEHARRLYLEQTPAAAGEPLVVVPSGNWHRKTATPRTIYSYENA